MENIPDSIQNNVNNIIEPTNSISEKQNQSVNEGNNEK